MAIIEIRLNGVDITSDVIFADAEFISQANGATGTCAFRVRDLNHTYHTIDIGDSITLDINGQRAWGGYVMQLNRGYFFEARDCTCPNTVPLYYRVIGTDYNVLLNRRIIFDPDTPENSELTSFPANTDDDDVIKFYAANHLDLSGDGIDTTTLVEHVGTPSLDQEISAPAGWTWNQFMIFVAYNTGSIWYIDPDKKLVYTDVDTPNAPFEISDQPGPGQIGAREMMVVFDGTRLVNDAMIWGAGKGSDDLAFGRVIDNASISEHDLWQVGRVVGGAWKQETVDRTAATYVDGSPQSQRGGKIDRHSVECVLFTHGFRVAQKVHVYSEVFGFDEVIPIRVLRITFPTTTDVRYQLTLAHEVDEPQHLVDPRPPFHPPDRICSIIHCGPVTANQIDETVVVTNDDYVEVSTAASATYRKGDLDWDVFISGGLNYWQWTSNPDFFDSSVSGAVQHQVDFQWDDLYTYTSLPGQLRVRGGPGVQYISIFSGYIAPPSNQIPGRTVSSWWGVINVTFTISGSCFQRPRTAIRPLFPFTTWVTEPLTADQVVSIGVIDFAQYGSVLPATPLGPDFIHTTEGTLSYDVPGELIGTRYSETLAPGTYTRQIPIGSWDAARNFRFWIRLKEVDFGGAGGTVDVTVTSVEFEWNPVIANVIGGDSDTTPNTGDNCEPRCITLGENCETAERIGQRSYRVLGLYSPDSTKVSVNGVRQQLGTDYTESDPANGVITFTYDVGPSDFVWICYSAYAIANQLPSITPSSATFNLPVSAPISGYFGPQPSLWPPEVWHGIYYTHFHNGVDFAVATGTPVYAAADGVVVYESQLAGGTMIHIYHDSPATPYPMRTTYAHLSSRVVDNGAFVNKGDHIAYSGATGNVTGAHLHWGLVMYGWSEDPLPWTTIGSAPEHLPPSIPGGF